MDQIPAKTLGELAMPDFCPRCFWLKIKIKPLPFQIFPGIFSSIDSYTKKAVHKYFDKYGKLPFGIGNVKQYEKAPNHNNFYMEDKDSNIKLTGTPDDIFRLDNSYVIVDYKTAKYTEGQERLLPMYEVQVNAYAVIAEECFKKDPQNYPLSPVSKLALVYMEPQTAKIDDKHLSDDGFSMDFKATVKDINIDKDRIYALMKQASKIIQGGKPASKEGCKDCTAIEKIICTLR